jgi:hypothetical protein
LIGFVPVCRVMHWMNPRVRTRENRTFRLDLSPHSLTVGP